MKNGIDVSSYQGSIDWKKAKDGGVEFAVIRSSFAQNRIDKCFAANLNGCEENDVPYGFYHYSYALTPEEAAAEADFFLNTVSGSAPELPLFLDFEESSQRALPLAKQAEIIDTFCEKVASAGFKAGLYANKSYLETLKNAYPELLDKYYIWVAQWNVATTYSGHYDIWQNSSTGKVPGIAGNVDTDICYTDFSPAEPKPPDECNELRSRIAELEDRLAKIAELAK